MLADNNTWWAVGYQGVSYGGNMLPPSNHSTIAIVDTGTSLLVLPKTTYLELKNEFINVGMTCEQGICASLTLNCTQLAPLLKDLKIMLDGATYTIPPMGYLSNEDGAFEPPGEVKCWAPIEGLFDIEGIAILGDTFMRNYYSTFDYEANTVSLAVSSENNYGQSLVLVTNNDDDGLTTGVIIGIAVGGFVLLVLIVVIICCCAKKMK